MRAPRTIVLLGFILSCGSRDAADELVVGPPAKGDGPPSPSIPPTDAPPSTSPPSLPPSPPSAPLKLVAVTYNTGTSGSIEHDAPPDDGYGSNEAKISSEHYGDGLAWSAAIADVKSFFAKLQPDVVAFQEIFHPEECVKVPSNARPGFVCATWKAGDPTVAQAVVGAGYQVACNSGKPDKCIAVKTGFGKIRGCSAAFCLDGLAGAKVSGCGGGSRVGRGVVDLHAGGEVTLVNVHGSSGMKTEDMDCRKKQVDQIFVNLDGTPAASGKRTIVLGDLNTDPGRLTALDGSAVRWNDFVGSGKTYRFISDVGSSATPTYDANLLGNLFGQGFNIDHIASNAFTGSCWSAGVTPGHAAVTAMRYFDHKPLVCALEEKK